MKLEDAYKRHVDLGFAPAWTLPSQRHIDRLRKIREEHERTIAERHAKNDERIAKNEQSSREMLTEHAEFKRLLREDAIDRQREDDRVEVSRRHDYRDFILQLRGALNERAQQELDDEVTGQTDDTANPLVRRLDAFFRDIWRNEGVDVRMCASDAIANGRASRKGRWIVVPPLKNLRTALILLHETGHIVHPDLADAREVLADDGYHKVSVPSEIASWRWVLDQTPVWTDGMHADMVRFISTYKSYAIESEVVAIDTLCSRLSFLETNQRIAKEF